MTTKELRDRQDIPTDDKLSKIYSQFGELLHELRTRDLTPRIQTLINDSIDQINVSTLTGTHLVKLIKQKQHAILKEVEKDLKIVPKNYYRNLWMVLGMSAIGLPFGVVFGLSLGNMALLGLGLPIGMGIGIAIGTTLDKKASDEGRQLNVELKY